MSENGSIIIFQEIQKIVIQNSEFEKNTVQDGYGGCIFINSYCQFYNNIAVANGGAGQCTKVSDVVFQNCQFYDNEAVINLGGAQQFMYPNNLKIINCHYENNLAYQQGADLNMKKAENKIIIQQCTFINAKSDNTGGSIDLNQCDVEISDNYFEKNYAMEQGGAINIYQMNYGLFNSNIFKNNLAESKGGAISLRNIQKIEFYNCTFFYNKAWEAGSLYLEQVEKLFLKDTIVSNSIASDKGGAIQIIDSQSLIFENSQIINNIVELNDPFKQTKGGGIYSQSCQIFQMINCLIQNNTALMKGGGIYLVNQQNLILKQTNFVKNKVYFENIDDKDQQSESYLISQGGAIYYLLDKNLQLQKQSQGFQIVFNNLEFQQNSASSGSSLLIYQDDDLKLKIKDFKNVDISMDLVNVGLIRYLGKETQLINERLQGKILNNYGGNKQIVIKDQMVQTGYIVNERRKKKSSYEFELCLYGTVLEHGGGFSCQKCSDYGICQGGYKNNYPKKGYWRDSVDSFDYIKCESVFQPCLGKDQCKQGYKGVLCQECDYQNNYNKSLSGECQKCPNYATIIVSIIFIYIFYVSLLNYNSQNIKERINKGLIKKYMVTMWGKNLNYNNCTAAQ
ncbi:Pectin lyase fold/virulence factor [Pseudocohnilembus persalinus]|uniref:Pectin lyase fold/virulence factor n=1 Tax=Pseudocohnilembus persalinus TaxID=266149 RepID=A0A0V0R6T0_PSEPJ|nr:Pectin lyase fold/virulence factor [Pseudocohnilembus persalinus]|eukprot:KRX10185.1 Pectin lyase fold/virulence factor [Pseudocohnilembus persalinus]